MKLYLVLRCGVHVRNFCGIFTTQQLAEGWAKKFLDLESDSYHDYDVCEVELDNPQVVEGVLIAPDAISNFAGLKK